MKTKTRILEYGFYALGILLILGFVYLYSSRFLFETAMPPAMSSLYFGLGRGWTIALNAAVFILFLVFLPYRRGIAWRSKGAFAAFILALMAEMFGLPLLVFIFSPLLPSLIPDRTLCLSWFSWLSQTSLGLKSGFGLIFGAWLTLAGMLLVIAGWRAIHQSKGLVTTGLYRYIRHPQYTGLFCILTGWIFHWPTLLTVIMYPILLIVYYRLAKLEEKGLVLEFGEPYLDYCRTTPRFFPRLFNRKINA